jgi:phosphoserine phosphatase
MVAGRFVTVFLGFLSPDGLLEWSSGGHGPILCRRSRGRRSRRSSPGCPPIGILDDMGEEQTPPVQLEPGGSLVVTSDGITESFAPDEQLYGDDRLIATLDACEAAGGCAASSEIVSTIHRAVIAWQGGRDEPKDDQTVVVVRRVE